MKRLAFVFLIFSTLATACVKKGTDTRVNLIFDTDMGNDVDDALALDMIYKYIEDDNVNLLGICTSKPEVESVEYLDIMRTWYGYESIPLGVVKNGVWNTNIDFRFARIVNEMKDKDGNPKYERSCEDYSTLPEASSLYRRLLSEAEDKSVVIVSVGFTTNLANLLDTEADEYSDLNGRDLVEKKVKYLSIMGGFFADEVTLEFNVTRDSESSKKIFSEWPTDMIFSPAELGLKVIYPGTEILKDFAWGNGEHPMVDGYISYFGPSYDRPCWDLTSVIYAVEGGVEDGKYFSMSGPGTVTMNDNGITYFSPSESGHHFILSVNEKQAQALVDRFVELTHRIPQSFLKKNPYKDASLSSQARTNDLLPRMSLEQKISIMSAWNPAIPELGIRKYCWWSEALHGVAADSIATVFPQNIGMAASFDPKLAQECFDVVSTEQRVKFVKHRKEGNNEIFQGITVWAPNVNMFRDPRWGRGQETYGEDPYLICKMGEATVNGLQGDTKGPGYDKLHACLKHFAVHSGPESKRMKFDVRDLSSRDLRETYLYAFEYLVKNTDVKEVMCAYNAIDGIPCCGSNKLLGHILRDEWGYDGLVVSDCWAINNLFEEKGHNIFPGDPASATSSAVRSGTDLECGSSYSNLMQGVENGTITEEEIDVAVSRLLKARFELGEMDQENTVSWNLYPYDTLCCPTHSNLSYKMALESMTLLTNSGILPLPKENIKVAVLGPNADDERVLWGNYNGIPKETVTALEGLKDKIGADNVVYSEDWSRIPEDQNVDAYLFIGGISPLLEGEDMPVEEEGFFGGDRTTIQLPRPQREAIERLHGTGKPVILVNMSGSAMGIEPETQTCDAILQAWYAGENGGKAIADVIFGDYNPGGKLPVTFYRSDSDLPTFEDYKMKERTYRYFKGSPLFPFGYGLSYTDFNIGTARLSSKSIDSEALKKGKKLKISIPVSNEGEMAGSETVQVYIRRNDDVNGPRMSLRGFERVFIAPGNYEKVNIALGYQEFLTFNPDSDRMEIVPGEYTIFYGNSSDEKSLKNLKFTIK